MILKDKSKYKTVRFNNHMLSRLSNVDLRSLLLGVGFMVFNATFNNISVVSWSSVLLVGETGVPRENHRPVASHRQAL